jgi:hypothetical protein
MPTTKEGDRSAMDQEHLSKKNKLGVVSGVYIPVCLNIISILMFLRFGRILGQIGLLGMLGENPSTHPSWLWSDVLSRSHDCGLHH